MKDKRTVFFAGKVSSNSIYTKMNNHYKKVISHISLDDACIESRKLNKLRVPHRIIQHVSDNVILLSTLDTNKTKELLNK